MRIDFFRPKRYPLKLLSHSVKIRRKLVRDLAPGKQVAMLEMAHLWADTVNRHGGNATVVHLPEIGIHGNTHFPFSDLNNQEIADLMASWRSEKGVD